MTWTLSLMLARMLASRFGLILAGISFFVLTLDVATYAPDILALHNDELSSIAKYALLRLPGVASAFVGIAALLALLLMLTELSHRSELVAIWNTGISQLRLILIIAPVALAIGACSIFWWTIRPCRARRQHCINGALGTTRAKSLKSARTIRFG